MGSYSYRSMNIPTLMGERRYVDGALVEPQLRLPFGYWEAKDLEDDLDKEIAKKFRRGYPQDNIIFENSHTAVLYQNKKEVLRCSVDDTEQIERLINQFFKFEPEIVQEFRKAVVQFKEDLPAVLNALRGMIEKAQAENLQFTQAAIKFLKHAQETINPNVTAADVREMLIQHILTEEIFSQVFDNSDFHHNNNVAKELYTLEGTFFTGGLKRKTLEGLKPYYAAIRSAAALVSSHQEKQKFLKVIYENFYKVYNKKAADRLKETYIKASTAQKTKLYDMYARFFRWASDRIEENGIVAFISNRSFVESRTFDGFRKTICNEFSEIYVVDLGGDVRTDPSLSGTKHNVFGIQTGVAISLMVKRVGSKGCRIQYSRRPQREIADKKLAFLGNTKVGALDFAEIRPNTKWDWINQAENDFETFVPIADKATKSVRGSGQDRAIFKSFSFGVVTNRDEWVYAENEMQLRRRVKYLIEKYNEDKTRLAAITDARKRAALLDQSIKWTRAVKRDLANGVTYKFNDKLITSAQYRSFVRRYLYFSPQLNEMQYRMPEFFGQTGARANPSIIFTDPTSQKPFMAIATAVVPDMHLVGAAAGSVTLPRSVGVNDSRFDNITDWALEQFRKQYEGGVSPSPGKPSRRAGSPPPDQVGGRLSPARGEGKITKDAMFHYVYGVLHDPVYREKYAQNLKREFPRIPFYADFWKWADWGEKLMALHIGYEKVEPWPLKRVDAIDKAAKKSGVAPKALLKALKETGVIYLDGDTQLTGVPREAWNYRLGNRSALEWILDQYKEKTPKDPTIREKFNTYKFADYKDHVIDLLKRVTRVSVETQAIIDEMKTAARCADRQLLAHSPGCPPARA